MLKHATSKLRHIGESGSNHELLSPNSTTSDSETADHTQPAWLATLLPPLPQPSGADASDEDDMESSSGPLFSSPADVRRYLSLQSVRIQLLQRLRASLSSGTSSSAAACIRYASLQLDVHLLHCVRALAEFATCAPERVHDCTPSELTTLQQRNMQLVVEALHVLRLLMHAAPAPVPVSVVDRLCEHNSAEVFLSIVENFIDAVDVDPSGPPLLADEALLQPLRVQLIEGALRCLATQLDMVSNDSPHKLNLLRRVYLHIPSHLQSPPVELQQRTPEYGSDSEILRQLIALVARRQMPLAAVSMQVLRHVAITPVPNEHAHSLPTCGNPLHAQRTSPVCTRGTPPTPVVVFPAHLNSTHGLLAASKLFVFPRNPALYLVERGLLIECLEVLQPFLVRPMPMEHRGAPQKSTARSLFRSTAEWDDEGEIHTFLSSAAILPLPGSPTVTSALRVAQMHSQPHGISEHHASLRPETEFMASTYTGTPKMMGKDGGAGQSAEIMQFPLSLAGNEQSPLSVPMSTSAPPFAPQRHHQNAHTHQSNEHVAVAIEGLTALVTRNAAVSAFVCSQPGIFSFLTGTLSHGALQLSLKAVALVVSMERALEAYATHTSGGDVSEFHMCRGGSKRGAPLVSIPALHDAALRQSAAHTRRHSLHHTHRRNSHSLTTSPNMKPASPMQIALAAGSPHLLALQHSMPSTTHGALSGPPPLLSTTDAHKHLQPLVSRSLQLLIGLVQQQWCGGMARTHQRFVATQLHPDVQMQVLALLAELTRNSASLQSEASVVVPTLVKLISSSVIAIQRVAAGAIRCLAALCSLHTPNRRVALNEGVMPKRMLQLLATRSEHPAETEKQQAALQLLTSLSAPEGNTQPASLQLSPLDEASLAVRLIELLDSSVMSLRYGALHLLCNLLLPGSPTRPVLVRAGAVPKLVRHSVESAHTWQAPRIPPLSDCFDALDACALPSLASQVRLAALSGLVNLTAGASTASKEAVVAALSIDGLLALLTDESGSGECAVSSSRWRVEEQAWLLLQNLLEPSLEEKTNCAGGVSDAEDDVVAAAEVQASSVLFINERDLIRLREFVWTRLHLGPRCVASAGSSTDLLAAVCAHTGRPPLHSLRVIPPSASLCDRSVSASPTSAIRAAAGIEEVFDDELTDSEDEDEEDGDGGHDEEDVEEEAAVEPRGQGTRREARQGHDAAAVPSLSVELAPLSSMHVLPALSSLAAALSANSRAISAALAETVEATSVSHARPDAHRSHMSDARRAHIAHIARNLRMLQARVSDTAAAVRRLQREADALG